MEEDIFIPTDHVEIEDKDYLSELVGEGKKFKDQSALARGKYEADLTIEVLKSKLDALNKELGTRQSMEDFMTQMKEAQRGQAPQNEPQTPQGQEPNTGIDDSTLEAKLEAILAQREAQRSRETNLERVTRVMKDNFGQDANLVITNKARDLGMTADALKALATSSPSAFLTLVGAQEQVQHPSPVPAPRTSMNTATGQSFSAVRDSKFYDKMKRDNLKQYMSPQTTVDMIRDRKALGDKW